MSLPKVGSSPSLSSHPSKQSLRRPSSRPHSINQQQIETPDEHPSPHIPANTDSHLPENEDQAQAHHESTPHIISQPFFTLIEDAHTSEYYHPTVHYIFSDDDTDIVTEAALRSLETDQVSPSASNTNQKSKSRAPQNAADPNAEPEGSYEGSPARKESLLPEPVPGIRDNYIILDIDHIPVPQTDADTHPTQPPPETQGQTQGQQPDPNQQPQPEHPIPPPGELKITSAHSLSPTWQVLNTQLLPAPTFETNSPADKPGTANASNNGSLMLQIQGTSGLPVGSLGRDKDKERGGQRLEDMMDQFARRLDELRLVIESGERGGPSDPGQMGAGVEQSVRDSDALERLDAQEPTMAGIQPEVEGGDAHAEDVPGEQ